MRHRDGGSRAGTPLPAREDARDVSELDVAQLQGLFSDASVPAGDSDGVLMRPYSSLLPKQDLKAALSSTKTSALPSARCRQTAHQDGFVPGRRTCKPSTVSDLSTNTSTTVAGGSLGVEHALVLPAGMSIYTQSEGGAGASTAAASLARAGGAAHDTESGLEGSWSSHAGQGGATVLVQPRSQQRAPQHAAGTRLSSLACWICNHASGAQQRHCLPSRRYCRPPALLLLCLRSRLTCIAA